MTSARSDQPTERHSERPWPGGTAPITVVREALHDYARYLAAGGHCGGHDDGCEACVSLQAFEVITARLEEAERQIRTEHEYKAAIGGGPCVCKWCAALGENTT